MSAITREGPAQFRVGFEALLRRGLGRIFRREVSQVDPFLVGRAIAEVMDACTVRGPGGEKLLWNEYRVILARDDFESLGALRGMLDRDLRDALARDVAARAAEMIGELRVSIVADEADELPRGQAVVRVAFVPTTSLPAPAAGEMTVRFDEQPGRHPGAVTVRWPGGEATLQPGVTFVLGRPHREAPEHFVALHGASAKINKEHVLLTVGVTTVSVERPQAANPVHAGAQPIAPGGRIEAPLPLQISLSKGDLVLVLSRP